MSTYFIAQITIENRQVYNKYLDGFDEVFAGFSGQVIAVDDDPIVLEGAWPCTRTVVISFPNRAEAERWYNSAEYRSLAQHRWQAATANAVLVAGRD